MSLKEALNSPNGKQFSYHLDVFTSGKSETINGAYAWKAALDPAIVDDIDVQVDNDGITIANGAYYSPPARSGTAKNVNDVLFDIEVRDIYQPYYPNRHIRTDTIITQDTGFSKSYPFTLDHSILVDGFDVGINANWSSIHTDGTAYSNTAMLPLFTACSSANVYIVDSDGNIVGNSKKLPTTGFDDGTINIMQIRGLNAYLTAGSYTLKFDFPNVMSTGLNYGSPFRYSRQHSYYASFSVGVFVYALTGDPLLKIHTDNTNGFDLFGKKGFKPSATAWRSIELADAPTDIFYTVKDKVPLGGASYTATMYTTNDPALNILSGITGWTNQGVVADGDKIITTDKYFRFKFYLLPTTGADKAPYIFEVSIDAGGAPLTFSQHTEVDVVGNANIAKSVPYLDRISWTVSGIAVDTGKAVDGKTTAYILANGLTSDVINFERGMRCELRFGVVGETDTTVISRGFLDDVNIRNGRYEVVILDTAAIGIDTKVPNDKYAPWDGVTTYNIGDKVAHNHRGYEALVAGVLPAPTGLTGDTNWNDIGTVWVNKDYAANTHLADIALDIVKNEINIPDRYIENSTFSHIRDVVVPNRRISALMAMGKQVEAKKLTGELAMLLECFWVRIAGRIGLVPEGKLSDSIVTTITHKDILSQVTIGLGKKSEVNTVFMQNGFIDGKPTDAHIVNDATLFAKHGNKIYDKAIDDRFGLPDTELTIIGTNYIARRNGGRMRFQFDRHMRLNLVSLGDVVLLEIDKSNAPSPDVVGSYVCLVESNKSDSKEAGRISLIEVKT